LATFEAELDVLGKEACGWFERGQKAGPEKKNWKSLQKKTKNNKLFDGLNVGKGRA
jgi:hypothetical protein